VIFHVHSVCFWCLAVVYSGYYTSLKSEAESYTIARTEVHSNTRIMVSIQHEGGLCRVLVSIIWLHFEADNSSDNKNSKDKEPFNPIIVIYGARGLPSSSWSPHGWFNQGPTVWPESEQEYVWSHENIKWVEWLYLAGFGRNWGETWLVRGVKGET
jgi:hypothetical protein